MQRMGAQLGNRWCCLSFGSGQSLSRVRLFGTPWTAARQASLSITNSWSLLKLMSIASTRQTFVGIVMSLLFNMLSRLVIAFLSRSKHLLISWLQSPSAVILESKKTKSVTVSFVSPSICHEVMGQDHCLLNVEF